MSPAQDTARDSARAVVDAVTVPAPSPETTQLSRKIRLSRLAMVFEQVWPRVWLVIGVAGAFVTASLAGLWENISWDLHRFLLALFGLALAGALITLFFIRRPTREAALRRIELNSDVPHRPASSYEDQLSFEVDASTSTIWSAHKKRLAALLGKLRVGGPRPRVDARDPFALRALLMISMVVLLVISGGSAPDKILAAFKFGAKEGSDVTARVDAWVTPPSFTKRAPIILTDGKIVALSDEQWANIYEVPERSQLVVRVAGEGISRFGVVATLGPDVQKKIKPSSINEAGDLAEFRLSLDETVTIKLNKTSYELFSWNFNVIPDADPKISLVGKPSLSVRGSLKLQYEASDDYGVASAEAIFKRVDGAHKKPVAKSSAATGNAKPNIVDAYEELFNKPLKFPLRLLKKNARATKGKTFKDVSAHPWAGLRVRMNLNATDQAGQVGQSRSLEFILPQRNFTKPLAKALIEQRRNLVKNPRGHKKVARALDALTIAPERFIPDKKIYLPMRSAYWRLKNAPSPENVRSVFDQLWEIALRIEDGDLSAAERALRTAQEKLQKALQENASNEEIEKLMKELRQAMSQFMQALARKQGQDGQQQKPPQQGRGPNKMLTAKDIDRMMKDIEKMLRSGSREAAQQMLSQLQELMEQMQTGKSQAGNQRSQQMMKSAQELGELIGKQQKLLDDTFQKQRQAGNQGQRSERGQRGQQRGQAGGQFGQGQPPGQQPGQRGRQGQQGQQDSQGSAGRLGDRQGQLRGALGKLMEGMRGMGGQPPKELDGAERAMRNAEGAIGRGELGRATRQQSAALDRLRKGTKKLVEQAMQGMAQRMGRNSRDPLGRAQQAQGPDLGASVKVPDEIDVQKAREILEELRRRLSDPSRPSLELDYIERLLKRF